MRPIKFRAWHFSQKKMFSSEVMTEDQLAILPDGHFANIDGQNTARSRIFSHDEILPLQFTGLLDKNGKEIYEGDIVTVPQYHNPLVVTWDSNGYFLFEGICNEACLGGDNDEVIGNIYENPNLLK